MTRSLPAALAPTAVAATLLLGVFSGTALAADQEEPGLSVEPSQACGRVTLDAAAVGGSYEIAAFAGPNDGSAPADPLGQFTVGADGAAKTFTLPEDSYGGSGFVSWVTVSGPEQDNYVRGAIEVATDCAPPDDGTDTTEPPAADEPEPTGTTEPTSDPAPTGDPTTEPTGTPPPTSTSGAGPTSEFVYYTDCAAVDAAGVAPLLATDPGYRPRLDADGDGVACDTADDDATGGEVDTGPAGVDLSQGIETGA